MLEGFVLAQNYPNPFNSESTIHYQLPKSSHIIIKIFTLLGQEIRTLINEGKESGYFTICWDEKNKFGRDVAIGIYICKLVASSGKVEVKRVNGTSLR